MLERKVKIKAIRKTQPTETHYDITVENTHNFFVNGVFTHNCNTSAVNAVIVGVNRGLNPVDELDIIQMAGRCVDVNSNILMADGNYKKAKDIKINDLIYAIDTNNKVKPSKINNIFHNKKSARLIQFNNGTEIIVSNHPLLSWEGNWVNSDSVQVGEKIAILANMPNNNKNRITFYSLFMEQAKNIDGRIRLLDNDFTTLKQLKDSIPPNLEIPTYKTLKSHTTSIATASYFNFDLRFLRSKNGSEFDSLLLKNNKEFLWLLGMLATDGEIKISKTQTTWVFTQTDKKVFDFIISVLNSINIKPCIYKHKPPLSNFESWCCSFGNYPLVSTMNQLGFGTQKTKTLSVKALLALTNEELANFVQGVIDGDGNINNYECCRIYTANKEFAYELKAILLQLGIRSSIKTDYSINNLTNKINNGYTIFFGKEGLLKLNSISTTGFKSKNISKLKKRSRPLKGDLFYTKISLIKELEEINLINFSVLETNTFIVEDIITHNCGRFGMAPYGNVFLICDSESAWKEKITHPKKVLSQLLDPDALSFHLCAEIRNGIVTNYDTMYQWYARTLASVQKPLTLEDINTVLKKLQDWKAITVEDDTFKITALGKVAATLYYHPKDCYHWAITFLHINECNLWESDRCIAYALAAPTARLPYIPKNEQEEVYQFMEDLREEWGVGGLQSSTLAVDLFDLLEGGKGTPQCRPIQMDAERITGALQWIFGIYRIKKSDFLKILPVRVRYGCSRELAELCMIPGIGKVKAKKLALMGITTLTDVVKNPKKVQQVVGVNSLKKTIDSVRLLLRQDYDM